MSRFRPALVLGLLALVVLVPPAEAHSYADPALRTVLDGVQPTALPAGVSVAVVPSVVDELVVTNPSSTVLEVKALGGEPFLRVSKAGVLANLASPDWYSTGTPEGGVPAPADVLRAKGQGPPRWLLVSRGSSWAEFDTRLHPPVAPTPAQRKAGKDAVLTTWRIPLTFGGQQLAATGHVLFSPVRGALQVAVTSSPPGLTATALQGELPGLFLRAATGTVVVEGKDGQPFLRFRNGSVAANTASTSWTDDQRAKGHAAVAGGAVQWTAVGNGPTYSWLDSRLRFPADQPGPDVLARTTPTVVQRWSIPITVDGAPQALQGTITWVPRAVALAQVVPRPAQGHGLRWWLIGLVGLVALVGGVVTARRPRGRAA